MRFDKDEDFKKRAYKAVVDLQNHKPEVIKVWKLICDISRKGENKLLSSLLDPIM